MVMNWAPATNGVAATTSAEVARFAHTSSGIRNSVIPGARIVMIVTRKLTAVAIDDAPAIWIPISNSVSPIGPVVENGGYPVQPASNDSTKNDDRKMISASGSSQNDNAFNRGNAM